MPIALALIINTIEGYSFTGEYASIITAIIANIVRNHPQKLNVHAVPIPRNTINKIELIIEPINQGSFGLLAFFIPTIISIKYKTQKIITVKICSVIVLNLYFYSFSIFTPFAYLSSFNKYVFNISSIFICIFSSQKLFDIIYAILIDFLGHTSVS